MRGSVAVGGKELIYLWGQDAWADPRGRDRDETAEHHTPVGQMTSW